MIQQGSIISLNFKYSDTITQINRDTAKFAQKVNMIDILGKLEEKSAYILFKDHMKNFSDKKQTRLINPTKTKLGFVSKDVIQTITSRMLSRHKYNLWKCYILTLAPAQKYYSKVMHRKEVIHSNGQ